MLDGEEELADGLLEGDGAAEGVGGVVQGVGPAVEEEEDAELAGRVVLFSPLTLVAITIRSGAPQGPSGWR